MRWFLIGFVVMIAGLTATAMLRFNNVSPPLPAIVAYSSLFAGAICQVWAFISVKRKADREMEADRRAHQEVIRRAQNLPPAEGVKLLLDGVRKQRRRTR